MTTIENIGRTPELLYQQRRQAIELRTLIREALRLGVVHRNADKVLTYQGQTLGDNIFGVQLAAEHLQKLRSEVLKKAKISETDWNRRIDDVDKTTRDFEFTMSSAGLPQILLKRDNDELHRLLQLRVGFLSNYEPIRKNNKLYGSLPWDEPYVAIETPQVELAYRIIYSRVLLDSSDHLVLDGTRLLACFFDKDTEISQSMYFSAFEDVPQLFVLFGYSETKNKLYPEILQNVIQRRLNIGKDCWVFYNPTTSYPVYGVDFAPLSAKMRCLKIK